MQIGVQGAFGVIQALGRAVARFIPKPLRRVRLSVRRFAGITRAGAPVYAAAPDWLPMGVDGL